MDFLAEVASKIRDDSCRIVFTEGEEPKIIQSAAQVRQRGIATPILIGDPTRIREVAGSIGEDLAGIALISPEDFPRMPEYVDEYSSAFGMPAEVATIILKKPLYFGAMMVRMHDADSVIAGLVADSDEVVAAYKLVIGLQDDITTPSSYCVVDLPHYHGQDGSLLMIADPVINVDPTPEELADIAIASARSARAVLDWEPRVAMLSFSTKGSAVHPAVQKVIDAVDVIRKRDPELKVDGELQLDAAVFPEVAKRKVGEGSPVAGKANILVFPNLDSCNIGTKLFFLTDTKGYGNFLQGFRAPVSDLTRSSQVNTIVGTAIVLAKSCQG
jgi:phosphate acetyltransferase